MKLRPRADLKALVAVSAPSNLAKYQLADVDRDGEIDRATTALAGIDVDVVGRDQPLSGEGLVERLRAGVDVLYLVCHGALIRQVPRLSHAALRATIPLMERLQPSLWVPGPWSPTGGGCPAPGRPPALFQKSRTQFIFLRAAENTSGESWRNHGIVSQPPELRDQPMK
ncbi:MAG: hypothetical protein GY856_43825 [bacterium]|nr:hypothetical protein [bacterium]